jgi:hypothetical protein
MFSCAEIHVASDRLETAAKAFRSWGRAVTSSMRQDARASRRARSLSTNTGSVGHTAAIGGARRAASPSTPRDWGSSSRHLQPSPPDAAIPAGMKPGRSRLPARCRRCTPAARAGARQRPRCAWSPRRAVSPQGCAREHRAVLQRGLQITARGGPGWKDSAEPCREADLGATIEGALCQDDRCAPFSRLVLEFARGDRRQDCKEFELGKRRAQPPRHISDQAAD